jgi:hypothetical protein
MPQSQRRRHVLRPRRLATPFHIRFRERYGVSGNQERFERQQGACLLSSGNDQRGVVMEGGDDAPQGMPNTDGRVQVDQGGMACRLRIAICHRHNGCLLQSEDIPEIMRPVLEER